MPSSQTPTGKTKLEVETLGIVEGLQFENGISQFSGIPYATLLKRWTRSQLKTSWTNEFHDGTKLGSSAPNPPEYNSGVDILIPAAKVPHFDDAVEDELSCLVMNITTPSARDRDKLPVMVYIHGGSFLYGGANRPVFDGVNFVSHSVERGTPVVAVNFNYRVGLGGFLASEAIRQDLAKDGFKGVGNFGLYDQQVALHWVQGYISYFGGDPSNVTIYGESAGGMSVSHQIAAKTPAPFHRAIAMSGHLSTIPTWSLEHHEKHYQALLTYLRIDPLSPKSLEELRAVPQHRVAAATLPVEGIFVCTGNPCDDGEFHAEAPAFDKIDSPPLWLKSYMVGDVLDEGMIFHGSLMEDNFPSIQEALSLHCGATAAHAILELYNITPETAKDQLVILMEEMAGDVTFRAHNWVAAHRSKVTQTYGYHFDQPCTHDSPLKGLAYHALDLLYLFLNFDENFTPEQRLLARAMADHWIDFAYGKDPWPRVSEKSSWMRYGPDDSFKVLTEAEDEPVRRYGRMQKIIDMGAYENLITAVDYIVVKRHRMGTFEWTPPPAQ